MTLSVGISKFTVDLSIIGAIVLGDYQNKLTPNSISIKSKSGGSILHVEYVGGVESRNIDYECLLKQWREFHENNDVKPRGGEK